MTAISLVVATYGRSEEVRAFLDSLPPVAAPGIEVILADQNKDDRVTDIIRDHPIPVRHLRLPHPNASAARNAGAALARHEWLGFPDDDCRFLPETLAQLNHAIATAGTPVISGATIDGQGRPNILRWRRRAGFFGRGDMWRCATESTLFIRRDLFLAVGGFDSHFGPGAPYPAAEGAELLLRVFDQMPDPRAWFTPTLRLYHPTKIPPWTADAIARVHDYAVGEGAMLAKHPKPACWWRTFRFIIKHAVAGILPLGLRARGSRRKLAGLISGYRAYRHARG